MPDLFRPVNHSPLVETVAGEIRHVPLGCLQQVSDPIEPPGIFPGKLLRIRETKVAFNPVALAFETIRECLEIIKLQRHAESRMP